nr:uncharacterized protein LOC104266382 isoform X1 [Ciona intestinalis]|eukprot:XP_009860709.1 uncharacterized protein LOC104266382 isoform X1 [Ciona intestinalis]
MVGCSIPTCTGNSRKGDKMYRFPYGERRVSWLANCAIEGWEPGANCKVCQHHFEPNQFKTNEDGARKLKRDAVPTKFHHNSNCEELVKRTPRAKVLSNAMSLLKKEKIKEEIEKDKQDEIQERRVVTVNKSRKRRSKRQIIKQDKKKKQINFLDFDFEGYEVSVQCTRCDCLQKEVDYLQHQLFGMQQRVGELEQELSKKPRKQLLAIK